MFLSVSGHAFTFTQRKNMANKKFNGKTGSNEAHLAEAAFIFLQSPLLLLQPPVLLYLLQDMLREVLLRQEICDIDTQLPHSLSLSLSFPPSCLPSHIVK